MFVTGDAGAGKSALLDGADLLTVCAPPKQPQPSGWWRNGDGVAFELPGLANEDSGIGCALWRAALRLLEWLRGRRPLASTEVKVRKKRSKSVYRLTRCRMS